MIGAEMGARVAPEAAVEGESRSAMATRVRAARAFGDAMNVRRVRGRGGMLISVAEHELEVLKRFSKREPGITWRDPRLRGGFENPPRP
jgi:hypothetical protein